MRGSIHAGKVPGVQRDAHVSPRLTVSRVCVCGTVSQFGLSVRVHARACRVRLKYVEQISVMVCMTSMLSLSPAIFPTFSPSLSLLLSRPTGLFPTNIGAGGDGTRRHSALMAQIVCNGCSLQLMYPRSADSGACVRES